MKSLLLAILTIFILKITYSQNECGKLDFTFLENDTISGFGNPFKQYYQFNDPYNPYIYSICEQADGKLLIGGQFAEYNLKPVNNFVRLHANGRIDYSFQSGTGFNGNVNDIEVLSDGKILVAGGFTEYNGTLVNPIVRLNEDGSIDGTFNPNPFNEYEAINNIELLPNGKFLLQGTFSNYSQSGRSHLMRFESNGTLDLSFDLGIIGTSISTLKVLPDNKILIGSSNVLYSMNYEELGVLLRLNSEGQIDNTFPISDTLFQYDSFSSIGPLISDIDIDSDGNYLIVGRFTKYQDDFANSIVKINPQGEKVLSFDNQLHYFNEITYSRVKILNSGKVMLGGSYALSNYNSEIYKAPIFMFHSDGQIDTTFKILSTPQGQGVFHGNIKEIKELANGKIIVGGSFMEDQILRKRDLVIYDLQGNFDMEFNQNFGFDSKPKDVVFQSDGKIVFVGDFKRYGNHKVGSIVRLNQDGTIDLTFQSGMGANNSIYKIEIQSDDKMIILGNFTSYDDNDISNLLRLNPDGTIDESYEANSSIISPSPSGGLKIQPNDQLLLLSSSFGPNASDKFIRLNIDGSRDNDFIIGNTNNFDLGIPTNIELDHLGNIYVATQYQSLMKFSSTGEIITNFYTGNSPISISSFVVLEDLSILTFQEGLKRYLVDGQEDVDFVSPLSEGVFNAKILKQKDNKILINSYDFVSSLNTSTSTLLRLNPNFMLDTIWSSYTLMDIPNIYILDFTIESDSSILIYGDFNMYDNYVRTNVARLSNCINTSNFDTIHSCEPYVWIDGLTYYESTIFTENYTSTFGCDSIVTTVLEIHNPSQLSGETFVYPTIPDECVGKALLTLGGEAIYSIQLDEQIQDWNSDTTFMIEGLCEGQHTIKMVSYCNDSLIFNFVIPTDSAYFPADTSGYEITDTLVATYDNCDLDYNSIYSVQFDTAWRYYDTAYVVVNFHGDIEIFVDTLKLFLPDTNSVYLLQITFLCPFRAVGQYIVFEYVFSTNDEIIIPQGQLLIFPNPTSSSVTIQLSGQSAQVKLYDAHGKFIREQQIISSGELSLVDVQSGIYMIEIITDQNRSIHKVIKQ